TDAPPCGKQPELCREDSDGSYRRPSPGFSPPAQDDVAPKLVIVTDAMMDQSDADADGSRAYTPSDSPKSAGHTPTSSATSGAGSPVESEPWSPSPLGSVRRAPIDVLFRVFPYMKRSVLQLILQGCHGDVVQAIEQVLNNHYADTSLLYSSAPPLPPSPYALAGRPNYGSPSAEDAKSAFSPLAAMGSNPLSYGYTGASGRGLAFALPYPPALLPNLASLSYSYNAMAAAAAVSMESHKADASDDGQTHLYSYATSTAEKIN
ncbi:Doublesex- and mab-3-related transcription factor A2, partial [Lamellibrachia satsuma]